MRIAILSFFSGGVERGVEVYVENLRKRFLKDHKIEVWGSSKLKSKVDLYSGKENFLLRRCYLDKTSLQIKRATQEALRGLKQFFPDIIYPVNNGWQSILAKYFCIKTGTKLMLAGHSGPGFDDRVNLWLKPDVFVVFSETQKQWARSVNSGVKIKVIPHAVDLKKFYLRKPKLNLKLERPIFVTVSALSPQKRGGETAKNIDATVKAVAKLDKGSLLLIGEGKDDKRIDELAKNCLGLKRYKRVSVSHNVINQYYNVGDVFTLVSSSSESFGLVYLEALASNLPVVTVDDSLRREIIGDAGVFIKNPNDVGEYSRGLQKAVDIGWGVRPRKRAKRFSWEKAVVEYEKLFGDLK